MKRIFIALIACLGTAWIVAGAQAQYPLPQPPTSSPQPSGPAPPAPPPPITEPPNLANCAKFPAKLSLARARYNQRLRTISIFAPLTTLASGNAEVQVYGARRITEFNLPVISSRGWLRGTRGLDRLQTRARSVIVTIGYPGDDDTRAQTLRLRAGMRPAKLSSRRPTISPTGTLDAAGAITRRARGIVRVQLEWVNGDDGSVSRVERQARIRAPGRWGVASQLPPGVLSMIRNRCSTVHAYVLFTGYMALNMNGEMRSYQVMPPPA